MSDKQNPQPPPPGFVQNESSSTIASAPAVSAEDFGAAPPYSNLGTPYTGPPPSYQNAMNYPASAPYTSAPYPANPVPSSYVQPSYVPPNITITTLPQPPPLPPQPTRVVVQVTPGPTCNHCGSVMRREQDICCILCLVILVICTFPFGLFFLCCLPFASSIRCQGCGRTM